MWRGYWRRAWNINGQNGGYAQPEGMRTWWAATPGVASHGDTHSDGAHSDVPHDDHSDGKTHSDVAHSDVAHGDAHTDTSTSGAPTRMR